VAAIVLLAVRHLDESLGVSAAGYGLTLTVLGAGSLVGGVVASKLSQRTRPHLLVSGMLLIAGAAIVAFALAPAYWVVLVSVALLGMSVVTARGSLDTITQLLAPDAVRGRVQSAVNLIIGASTALAEGLSALLGDLLGVRTVFLGAGALTAGAGVAAWWILRRFDAEAESARGESLLQETISPPPTTKPPTEVGGNKP
jgi:predicted MFS family arabinose efflux permease